MSGYMFSIDELKVKYPDAIVNDTVDFEKLYLLLAGEVSDLQDQLNEKDYQILRITQRLDQLERR